MRICDNFLEIQFLSDKELNCGRGIILAPKLGIIIPPGTPDLTKNVSLEEIDFIVRSHKIAKKPSLKQIIL